MIGIGDKLPDANVLHMSPSGPETLKIADLVKGKQILIFGLPGAFTPTCTNSHLPGYVGNAKAFYAKGIDAIYCHTVNDIFTANAWGEMIGAGNADVRILADAASEFAKALGVEFSNADVGLYDRAKRYALIAQDGVVTHFEIEDNPGVCQLSSAEHMLNAL